MSDSICIFGDSIMKGVIFDSIRGRYIYLKNSFLNILGRRNSSVRVDNFAKFGCTITAGKKIIEKHSDKLPGYRFTALEFGGNDCDFDWKSVPECPDGIHLPKTPLDEFESLYSKIIDDVSNSGSKPVLFSLPPLSAERYFAWISKGLNAGNILRWLGDVGHIYRWHEMYNNTVVKIAEAKNVLLIDIREAFLKARDYLSLLCEDGIHPNEAGHALISDVVMNALPAFS
jgi:acyl-CoA thioesterase-1